MAEVWDSRALRLHFAWTWDAKERDLGLTAGRGSQTILTFWVLCYFGSHMWAVFLRKKPEIAPNPVLPGVIVPK